MKIALLMKFGNVVGLEYLKVLNDAGIELCAIVFQGDSYSIKDREIFESRTEGKYKVLFLGEVIQNHKGSTHYVKDHNSENTSNLLNEIAPDILIFGGVDIIKEKIIKSARYGAINTHPGSLPEYRGCCAVEWSILNDDAIAASCHLATAELDLGPIIYKEELPLFIDDEYSDIRARMVSHQGRVMLNGLKALMQKPSGWTSPNSKGMYRKVMRPEEIKKVMDKIKDKTYKPFREILGA